MSLFLHHSIISAAGQGQPTEDTITIGSFVDPVGDSRYLGYVSPEAALPELPAFGDISNRQFFGEVEPVQLFTVVDGGQQGVLFISIFTTSLDVETVSTPDVGNFNAIIDGTPWLLTRQEAGAGTEVFQYFVSDPANGLSDLAINQAFYDFLDAREGQTVTYQLEEAAPLEGIIVGESQLITDFGVDTAYGFIKPNSPLDSVLGTTSFNPETFGDINPDLQVSGGVLSALTYFSVSNFGGIAFGIGTISGVPQGESDYYFGGYNVTIAGQTSIVYGTPSKTDDGENFISISDSQFKFSIDDPLYQVLSNSVGGTLPIQIEEYIISENTILISEGQLLGSGESFVGYSFNNSLQGLTAYNTGYRNLKDLASSFSAFGNTSQQLPVNTSEVNSINFTQLLTFKDAPLSGYDINDVFIQVPLDFDSSSLTDIYFNVNNVTYTVPANSLVVIAALNYYIINDAALRTTLLNANTSGVPIPFRGFIGGFIVGTDGEASPSYGALVDSVNPLNNFGTFYGNKFLDASISLSSIVASSPNGNDQQVVLKAVDGQVLNNIGTVTLIIEDQEVALNWIDNGTEAFYVSNIEPTTALYDLLANNLGENLEYNFSYEIAENERLLRVGDEVLISEPDYGYSRRPNFFPYGAITSETITDKTETVNELIVSDDGFLSLNTNEETSTGDLTISFPQISYQKTLTQGSEGWFDNSSLDVFDFFESKDDNWILFKYEQPSTGEFIFDLTIGNDSSDYGYNSLTSYGSISPSDLGGASLAGVYTSGGTIFIMSPSSGIGGTPLPDYANPRIEIDGQVYALTYVPFIGQYNISDLAEVSAIETYFIANVGNTVNVKFVYDLP